MSTVLIEDSVDVIAASHVALTRLGIGRSELDGATVFLKPNLTYPRHKPGVTTSPYFISSVIETFSELGAHVIVGEGDGGYGSWSADVAFEGHGLHEICRHHGARLVNLSTQARRVLDTEVNGAHLSVELPSLLLDEVDLFVTLPVPKVHAMTVFSGAVKNQWGCLPDTMRLRRHPEFMHLIWGINAKLKPSLVLGDARYILDRSGPMWGDPVYMNRFVASDDILAFDITVAEQLMGLDVAKIPYLAFGRGLPDYDWHPAVIDTSTGPVHQFSLTRSIRHRVTAAAFSRRWAVDLLWFSPLGRLAHLALYAIVGNPVADERAAVHESSWPSRDG